MLLVTRERARTHDCVCVCRVFFLSPLTFFLLFVSLDFGLSDMFSLFGRFKLRSIDKTRWEQSNRKEAKNKPNLLNKRHQHTAHTAPPPYPIYGQNVFIRMLERGQKTTQAINLMNYTFAIDIKRLN